MEKKCGGLFYMTFATKNLKARCDVAWQPLWRYVKGRHRSCDDTWSFATNGNKFPSFLTPHIATSKSSATSQCTFKFFSSEHHVKKDSTFFFHSTLKMVFLNLNQKISPLSVKKKHQRWCRKSKRIDSYPFWPPSFLAGQYSMPCIMWSKEFYWLCGS